MVCTSQAVHPTEHDLCQSILKSIFRAEDERQFQASSDLNFRALSITSQTSRLLSLQSFLDFDMGSSINEVTIIHVRKKYGTLCNIKNTSLDQKDHVFSIKINFDFNN
jgi:hypothetical protein